MAIKWEDRYEQFGHLEDDQLLHIARNESAQHGFRITAVELLRQRKSVKASHPELVTLNRELDSQDEQDFGIYPLPEVSHESEVIPVSESSGPLTASVTTQTMFGVQKMDTDDPPADEAPILEKQIIQENSREQ